MKWTSFILSLFLFSIVNAQKNRIISGFKACEENFYIQTLLPTFGQSSLKDNFKIDSINSYFNYIDSKTNESYLKVEIKNSDTISSIPTQYVLILNVIHNNKDIGFIRVDCHYQDNLIKADRFDDLKDYLKPQLKVIDGKVINLEKALKIAKNKGYKITSWKIDYEKKKGFNEYKKFKPKLIWTLKEKEENGKRKVLQINAKSEKIENEFIEFSL